MKINTSNINGITYRMWQDANDYQLLETLGNQYNKALQIDGIYNAENERKWLEAQKNYDPTKRFFIAESEETPIAVMTFYIGKETDGPYLFRNWIVIHPDWIKTDLPAEMYRIVEEAMEQAAQTLPAGAKAIHRNGYEDKEQWRADLLTSQGYQIIRYFYEMKRSIELPVPERKLPEGFEIKPIDTKEKEIAVIKADDIAFRDHFEHVFLTEERMQAWMSDSDYDPSLWKVAWDGDTIAGAVMNFINKQENQILGRKRGYTEDITCQRPYRGQGIASALIAESIKMFREMGMEEVALSVDTANPSGALGLYQSFGYEPYKEMFAMSKEIKM